MKPLGETVCASGDGNKLLSCIDGPCQPCIRVAFLSAIAHTASLYPESDLLVEQDTISMIFGANASILDLI